VTKTSNLKSSTTRADKLSITFYLASGILLLALLPIVGLAPHLVLVGVLSLIAAVAVLAKKSWALWVISILFVTASVFSLYTIFASGASNLLITAGLAVYFAFAVVVTMYMGLWRKPSRSSKRS
jgi:hypothetical protein